MGHVEIRFLHGQKIRQIAAVQNDFFMGHVEIWFLFTSATGDFMNFLKMYGNFSMAIANSNSYRNKIFHRLYFLLESVQNLNWKVAP